MQPRILKPLSYGELFDEAIELYRKHFLRLIALSAIDVILNAISNSILTPIVSASASSAIYFPMSAVLLAAMALAISEAYLGKSPTIREVYRRVFSSWAQIALTMALLYLAIIAGSIALLIPGIMFFFLYIFTPVIMVSEKRYYREALKRSWKLVASDKLRVIVVTTVSLAIPCLFIYMVDIYIFNRYLAPILLKVGNLEVIRRLIAMIVSTLVLPIMQIPNVILYYDIRVRKEGFDVQMLAEKIEEPIQKV